ncbi:sushi, von Willebrand factor type A, EGF and pentraxin domain-containing protein 1 isoform X2 [Oryzias melastigma]|uniref:sushi, von Willebrand factor type A, EGF and pentraxin domain-containing protein 1 isoform X2 n=1 Tax=Oryzias melastigma TaxID=30732 RepID=UPI000CF7C7C3|nr:sushi, von Willebrand factor type A, EGF and pentraxin domain-containing protein 1 isoform X2 [Oryzias melastigma]
MTNLRRIPPPLVFQNFLRPDPSLPFLLAPYRRASFALHIPVSHFQSGAQMGIPEVLVIAVCLLAPVCAGVGMLGCSNMKHLENGQTFFRYGGLLVTFRCNPGFKLHGYKTNSCLSGIWSRDLPVCVGSGCSVPGLLMHGTIHMNEDGSWVEFSCNNGFRLHGPSKLYCRGHSWNGTNPVCREWDINMDQTLQIQQHLDNQAPSLSKTPDLISSLLTSKQASSEKTKTYLREVSAEDVDHTVPSTSSFTSGKEPQESFSITHAPDVTDFTGSVLRQTSNRHYSKSPMTVLNEHASLPDNQTVLETATGTDEAQHQTQTQHLDNNKSPDGQYPPISVHPASTSSSSSASHADSLPLSSISTQPPLPPSFTVPSTPFNNTDSLFIGNHIHFKNLTVQLYHRRWPACPYPPVPAHGTFYIRNIDNPNPGEFRYYIEYVCSPGYTLVHGDRHNYCQQGGNWSGTTPVCLELNPCAENNGGCSQLCSYSRIYNQNLNQMQTTTQCHCRPGFALQEDGRTCRDVDECLLPAAATGCMFGCVNTAGSFHCQCPPGHSKLTADGLCHDTDECVANQGLGPCMHQCHNSAGSYRCSCTFGYILAADGHDCLPECPSGYRKFTAAPPENMTVQPLKGKCVDINECLEEMCEWRCVNLPGSHRCICPRGYTLQRDGQHCTDINECNQKNGGCSHHCVNRGGGYKCSCPASHRLSPFNWRKCSAKTNTAG